MIYPNINIDELSKYEETFEIEKHVQRLNKMATKDTKGLIKALIVYRDNKDLLSEESLIVINKLLGDTKILKKVRLINDGSYRMNRIWGYVDLKSKEIIIRPYFDWHSKSSEKLNFDKLSTKEKIDWIYNHFELIYVQVKLVKSREDIMQLIFWEIEMDKFDCW